ncbi:MAG: ABC-F family ATP-binding cassette domain-containing protein [Cytophagales bacterium]|nr:ABC-F family ATP-binding cassette domain-containing protein [Cytophagales bacterium]
MLSLNNLSFYFGSRALYENISLHIKPKDKIGLIGANGAGKSTLLRLIVGEYAPDEGTISKSKDCSIGFLNQDLLSYQSDKSILSVAMEAFEKANAVQARIDEILKQLETDYSEKLVNQLSRLQEEFETLDGYTLQSKAEEILEGLGFKSNELQLPLEQFSGGWRMRVMLAKILLAKPALLLLDEPTNHLDLPSIEWFENYVKSYEGAVIIVSHDQDFLNNTVKSIAEVSFNQIHTYSGDYDFYLKEKEMRNELQQNAFENQQKKIKETEEFITRFKAKATKAKQVQSRVKALDRLDRVDEIQEDNASIQFNFNFGRPSGKVVLDLKELSKAYGDRKIFEKTNASILRGDKIALIGANGKGKSTLLRIIKGEEEIGGMREEGHNVESTFFAQHQLEALTLTNTVLGELLQAGSQRTELELRSILGSFLFTGDDVFKNIKVLSGGEKSRVALAKTLITSSNFLLLDEPTNHLDMRSVNMLIQALEQYEGSFVVVSHNRHFIQNIANKVWYIEDYQIKEYPGTYSEFVAWKQKKDAEETKTIQLQESKVKKEKKSYHFGGNEELKALHKELKKCQKELEKIESKIEKLEEKKINTEQELAKPSVYEDTIKLQETSQEFDNINVELGTISETWENLAIEIEEIEEKIESFN